MKSKEQGMNRIFYYSEECSYCKEAFEMINKIGVEKFVFKDIEQEKDIPNIIDRVPTLLTSENNNVDIYYEEKLFKYLDDMLHIEPFMVNEMGSGLSDKYSYVDNSGLNLDHVYQFLDKETKINTPSESDNNKIINYDKFVSERDNDLKIMG